MQFRILGSVEACHDGRHLPLGGPQQRALLAVLLLDANRVVSADRLITDIWGERSPANVRGLLRGCVARLRRVLQVDGAPDAAQPLVTRDAGYLLRVQPGDLDLHRVEQLDDAARAAAAAGTPQRLAQAADLLSEALALWRGPALGGLPSGVCQAQAARLEEQRLALLEQRIDLDLQLGRHARLAGELQLHVREHPLRERLWAQLMVALDAGERPADALAAYQQVRQLLVDRLGMEPGAMLQEVERAVLVGGDAFEAYRRSNAAPVDRTAGAPGPERAVEPEPVTPAQLPPATAAFTGRTAHLKQLDALLAAQTETVVISAIAGTAGVGKTTLAVHWAYQVRDRFPDGQLYVNLRGYASSPPLRPIDALAGFLNALGVPPERVPAGTEQMAGLYRSVLTGKRMLVLLDNAGSAEQVRPLLPGSPGCLVLVTSRDRLGGLLVHEGAHRVTLDVLSPEESQTLLARLLGPDRMDAEPAAAVKLAAACAHLPLALRIAAAVLTDDPQRTIESYVAELTAGDRLESLTVDGDPCAAVRAALDLSYATLEPATRRLFRLLGLVPGPDFTADVAAALLATPVAAARPLLDRLAGAHLVGQAGPGRYAFHDLLRLHAADHAEREDSPQERDAAIRRVLDWYLHTADGAAERLTPIGLRLEPPLPAGAPRLSFGGDTEASAWLDAERANLVAAVQHAAEHGPRPVAVRLADALRGYFTFRMNGVDGLAVAQAALAAAEADDDRTGAAAAHLAVGNAVQCHDDYRTAAAHYARAAEIARQTGWLAGEAMAVGNVGVMYRLAGRLRPAAEQLSQALALEERVGRLAGRAHLLSNLGNVYLALGRPGEAADLFGQALAIDRQFGYRLGEAADMCDLGHSYLVQGRLEEAGDILTRTLRLYRELDDPDAEAEALRILAQVHNAAGRHAQARETAQAALSLTRALAVRWQEAEVLNVVAAVELRLGRHLRAIDHHKQAQRLAREIDADYVAVTALIGLAAAHRQAGQVDVAASHAERAVALAHEAEYRILEGEALTALADIHHARGRPGDAISQARRAVDLHRASGHRLGLARALVVLGHARCDTGDADADADWREALDLFTACGAPEADRVRTLIPPR